MRINIPTGCFMLDKILEGGLPPQSLILVYGAAETGKTTLAIQCAVNAARLGYKTIFIDSDNSFPPERLSKIASDDLDEVSTSIIIIKPSFFMDQGAIIDHLEEYLTSKFGLIVVDTVTSLYRVNLGTAKETFVLNRELNRQVAALVQIAKSHELSVLLTSQVRSVLIPRGGYITPVATRVLRFWSNVVISLESAPQKNVIIATVEKPTERSFSYRLIIGDEGIRDYNR